MEPWHGVSALLRGPSPGLLAATTTTYVKGAVGFSFYQVRELEKSQVMTDPAVFLLRFSPPRQLIY